MSSTYNSWTSSIQESQPNTHLDDATSASQYLKVYIMLLYDKVCG